MTVRDAYIALNLISGIGPATVRHLVSHFGSPEHVFDATPEEVAALPGIGPKKAAGLAGDDVHTALAHELELMEQHGIEVVLERDPHYPARLREIKDAPCLLYVQGDKEVLRKAGEKGLAVIGTRMLSNYGETMARQLAGSAARAGWVIVSGLAKGIDAVAHDAALNIDGLTVAVTGCGLTHTYPPENKGLTNRIAKHGCLISEQPMTMRPDRRTFPMRNRIVAGMCDGTLVIEAGTGSGSMITAEQAFKYGRTVYAVPGRVDSPNSRGCHELIRRGAKLTESLDDIQNDRTFLPGFDSLSPAELRSKKASTSQSIASLSEDEERIVSELRAGEMDLEILITRTGMPVHRLLALLMQMELKRIVRQLPGKVFVLSN